ncbi:transcriptional regulator [Candidatus Venteria ishoeyi]|uniref:helix-turn-helix domain-containing protein n=1 Tax=Candidatus Venteria ishoeyi TaxID=1899563 RepID=UPI0025A510E4|nr:transcriptional regulator [Candidatus Venteria ishoeyi]MDM8546723.1 transcriptional regulator [Candidatus Venteria ishoeyi]
MTKILQDASRQWANFSVLLSVPQNEQAYQQQSAWIDELVDEIGEDTNHPLAELLNTLGTLLHAYELEHYPEPQAEPADILRLLMSEHDLKQSDLPEIGSQGVVSEILNGKRQLNIRQIQRLSKKFHISAATFLP